MRYDLHTHILSAVVLELIRNTPGDFAFGADPTGRTIIRHRGARFFGVTAPMTDPAQRLADMDRVGIDVEVLSVSTPNVFFAEGAGQTEVARVVNDAYAELIAQHPARFKGFASIPMDAPDAALRELDRALGELRLNGVVLLSNIRGRALTDPSYRPFFEEANRRRLCIFLHPMIPVHSEVFNEYAGPAGRLPVRYQPRGRAHDFPDIRWVIGHLGGAIPYLMERLDNGYRDSPSAANIKELPSTFQALQSHRELQRRPAHGARDGRRRPHGDGQRLSPHARLDRSRGESIRAGDSGRQAAISGTALRILNIV